MTCAYVSYGKLVFVIGTCCMIALFTLGVRPPTAAGEVPTTAWNEVPLLTAPDGQPRWPEYVPPVAEADQPYLYASPPASEVESCLEWIRQVVNPAVVPADLTGHLLALQGWPQRDGADVFVTWYQAGSRLVYLVEGNWDLTVFTTLLNEEALAPVEEHLGFALRTAEAVLAAGMLPHPADDPARARRLPESGLPGVTAGCWRPAIIDLRKDDEGRFFIVSGTTMTMRVPDAVKFVTDGKFVRFQLRKMFGRPSWFPRFDVPPYVSTYVKPQPKPIVKHFTPMPGSEPLPPEPEGEGEGTQ
jgi:hypothetical protein